MTVSGHLSLRGRRIRARPRSNKRRRSPKPMRCLSADNGDQFCAEKNWREREMSAEGFGRGRSCLQQQQEEGKRLEKAGAGWDSCIDRAIFVRPSLTEPPEILLLFSSFSAPLLLPLLFLKLRPGEKWRRVCRLIDPSPPGHLHPMRSRFFADIAAVRVGHRPDQWGQTFFLPRPPHPTPPPPPPLGSTTGKSEALPPSPSGGLAGQWC